MAEHSAPKPGAPEVPETSWPGTRWHHVVAFLLTTTTTACLVGSAVLGVLAHRHH